MHPQRRSVPRRLLLVIALLLLFPTLACSLSGGDADATATYEAAEAFATETAEAAPTPSDTPEPDTDDGGDNGEGPLKPKVRGTATPAVDPTDEPAANAVMVTVNADGSGDYGTVADAVASVPAGSTIELGAGTFEQDVPLAVAKSITIRGAGQEASMIVSAAPEAVVRFEGGGTLTLANLSIAHTGEAEADGLLVEGGTVDLDQIVFSGAATEDDGTIRAGVRFTGEATGYLTNCTISDNDYNGVRVLDSANIDIADCVVVDNEYSGIVYRDSATGSVKSVASNGNGKNGVIVSEEADILVDSCTFEDNGESGLVYFESGAGTASNNVSMGNGLHGISVNDDAIPLLSNNTCANNAEDGIAYFERAGGTAGGNTCTANGLHGIGVTGEAQPLLRSNVCTGNTEVGIRYSGSSGGTAELNEVRENALSGFIVTENAAPALVKNVAADNVESGIAYFQNGGGSASDNEVQDNGLHGFDIYGTSAPMIELNVVTGNAEVGIRISDDAVPWIVENAVERNTLSGMVAREQAAPTIEDNWIEDNGESGISYFGSAAGGALNNEIEGNGLHGISVNDDALPVLDGNISRDNTEAGVAYFERATGILRGGTMTGNKWGIYVIETANPAIGDNEVTGNTTDVDDRRPAGQRPTPPPAADPVVQPTEPAVDGGVLFADDFSSPDPGWWEGSSDNGEVWFEDGELRVLNWTEAEFAQHTTPGKTFADVAISVESRLVEGSDDNWHDVMCRRQQGAWYVAGFSADGYVKLGKEFDGAFTWLLDIQASTVVFLGTGATNTVELICDGSTITYRLNGQLIAEVQDSDIDTGDIALAVASMDGESSTVAFDNLEVRAP